MKRFLVLLFSGFFVLSLFASTSIKGKIIDAGTESPIDFVSVAVFHQDSKTVTKSMVSNQNGEFEIPALPKGKYTLRLSYLGYNTLNMPLEYNGDDMNLGVVKLQSNNKQLKEVEVVGQGTTVKFEVDKKVFSVDQNIAAAGGSASEVLQNIPSVTVDNEGNVALRNSTAVEVWINGKPSGLTAENRGQILQQMPAESIESIEVMTNPSAKFKAEGSAGIINLVLKKNRKAGYYGSLSVGGLYNTNANKLGGTLGGNFSYSSKKLDANVNVGYRRMNMPSGGSSDRKNYLNGDTLNLHQENDYHRSMGGLFSRLSLDYHISDNNTLSFSGFGMLGGGTSANKIDYLQTNINKNDLVLKDYYRNTTSDGTRRHMHSNLDFQHDFDKKGSNIIFSLGYSAFAMSDSSLYKQTENLNSGFISSDLSQVGGGNSNEYEFKVDFTKKFSENSKLEAGWESNLEHQISNASGYDFITSQVIDSYYNKFDYTEQNHAAYATYGNRFDKLSIQGGLRAEYYSKAFTYNAFNAVETLKPTGYPRLFPSLFLSYSLPKNNEIQLNVTSRVNRPRGMQINPYKNYSDSTNISYGNPELTPEYTSAYEFNYIKTWENHSLSGSAYYRFTDKVIQGISFMKDGIMQSTSMNLTKQQNSGVELVAKNRIFQIVNLTSSLNFYYSKMDSASYIKNDTVLAKIPQQKLFSWNARVMANFALSKTLFGQISGEYNAPRLIAQGKELSNFAVDLGLRKTFMDKKINLNLMVRDVFDSRKRQAITFGEGYSQTSYSYWGGRMIGLTATYNFGNMKPKKQQTKENNSQDMNIDNME
ncbi:MAG TPA: outer membrane beta-barrel protein [Paludibacter sp.]|nr:outer membrane beta-barrel protein [Paludibacter sp.]